MVHEHAERLLRLSPSGIEAAVKKGQWQQVDREVDNLSDALVEALINQCSGVRDGGHR